MIEVTTEESLTFPIATASGETEVSLETSQEPAALELELSQGTCGAALVGARVFPQGWK